VDVLYNVEVVYSVLLTPSYTVVPDPDTRALLAWASGVGVAICTVEYSMMVLVDRKVVFCEAGQFLTVEGQAVTVYTSVMYLVKVVGSLDGGLEMMTGESCVLDDDDTVGTATTTGALLIDESRVGTAKTTDTLLMIGWDWAELERVVFWKIGREGRDTGVVALIAVLRAGTAVVDESDKVEGVDSKVLVKSEDAELITVVLPKTDADGLAIDMEVLLALTAVGTRVEIVVLREA
jgi:hypothetical protein